MSSPMVDVKVLAKTSGTALKVYTVLVDRAFRTGKTRFTVRRKWLASSLGYAQVRSVSKALTVLAKAGWIRRKVRYFKNDRLAEAPFRAVLTVSMIRLKNQLRGMDVARSFNHVEKKPAREPSLVDRVLSEMESSATEGASS